MKNTKRAPRMRTRLLAGAALVALPSASMMSAQATDAAIPAGDDTIVMDIFDVTSSKDYGYLRTNSATATRIAMKVQAIPLNISILGGDFIKDVNIREISDVLRYASSASGDNRMGIRAPGNPATPSGFMKLRGFPISQRLRNGVSRYTTHTVDNADRIEIIKGPAAIFFGLGYPGGVINYVTKKPVSGKNFTGIGYQYGGSGGIAGSHRATLDQNTTLLPKKAAFRVVGAWDNLKGDQDYEYQKGWSLTPSIIITPFDPKVFKATFEYEHTEYKRNIDDASWNYNENYFKDYYNPSASLLAAAGINPGDSDALAQWRAKNTSYATWTGFKRAELGDRYWAAYRTAARGAYYNAIDPANPNVPGARIHDDKWNMWGRGSWGEQKEDVIELTLNINPFPWLSLHYVYTREQGSYEALTATTSPNIDGNTFNYSNLSWRKDCRTGNNHQLDVVVKKSFRGTNHTLLFGGIYNDSRQKYYGNGPFIYNNIPGASLDYDAGKSANGTDNIPPWYNQYNWGLAFQKIYNRAGIQLNSHQLYTQYDPAIHVMPDINRPAMTLRNIVDAGNPRRDEQYFNYMGDFLKNRLRVMGGCRWTKSWSSGGQQASSNPPWFAGCPNMMYNLDPSLYNAYGIGSTTNTNPPVASTTLGSYYLGTFAINRGESYMVGASFDIVKDITLYFSRSQSFRPVSARGAMYDIGAFSTRAADKNRDPAGELARIRAEGADKVFHPEKGINTEFGVKTSLRDGRLTATASLFQLDRQGEALDDTSRQQADPMNYTKTGEYKSEPVNGGVRWYSNSSRRRVEGIELDVIWTPARNFQLLANGSWLWKAKTLLDTSINMDPAYLAGISATVRQAMIDKNYYTYDFRMPGVPEWRFNLLPSYTVGHGALRGLRGGIGMRYTSVMNVQNSNLYDSKHGGLTAGNFVAFDLNVSYPWEVRGFKFVTHLTVTNLTDRDYCEGGGDISTNGGFNYAPRRTWVVGTEAKF
ncbi:MAG: TonB-dependent receptor [Opitutaceae bacterium]|nr:TonB-dependent receptor [Opitutaceae bacterium]